MNERREHMGKRIRLLSLIVYYEGKALWTAERRFHGRVSCGETFRSWVPDFTYEVVRLHDYSNEELLARGEDKETARKKVDMYWKIEEDGKG